MIRTGLFVLLLTAFAAAQVPATSGASSALASATADARLPLTISFEIFSVDPSDPVGSFRLGSRGGATGDQFDIDVSDRAGDQWLWGHLRSLDDSPHHEARLRLGTRVGADSTVVVDEVISLGALTARSDELARTPDGRRYVARLIAERVAPEPVEPMHVRRVGLYDWNIDGHVFVDGVHRSMMKGWGGNLFGFELPDLGDFTFSLLPRPDAEPRAVFSTSDAEVRLQLDGGEEIVVSGVAVGGPERLELERGLFTVWVEHRAPVGTIEDRFAELRTSMERDGVRLSAEEWARVETAFRAGRAMSTVFTSENVGPLMAPEIERGMRQR